MLKVKKTLVNITGTGYEELLDPNPSFYRKSQEFGKKIYEAKEWGIIYPSVRSIDGICVAIFRPTALTIPIQGCHLRYIWDGKKISEVYKESKITNI